MSKNTKKLKRISNKTNDKISLTQKKLRNENEKRRRDLFSQLITNIGEIILNKTDSPNQPIKLSKNAILRQTVAFLQEQRNYFKNEFNGPKDEISSKMLNFLDFSWKPSIEILSIEEWFQISIESMNCFFVILNIETIEKKIVYISKNIINYLGYCQDELLNRSIYDIIHPNDHRVLNEYFHNENETLNICKLLLKQCFNNDYEECSMIGAKREINRNENYFISIIQIESLDKSSIFDLNSNEQEQFSSHLNNQGKFIYLNSKGEQYLGYQSFELIGRSYFDFVHPDDLPIVKRAHQLWIQNGYGNSDPHRFLTKGQQWIFIQTNSQVQINSWNKKPLFYICNHQIIQCSINLLKQQLTNVFIDPTIQDQQQTTTTTMSTTSSSSPSEISSFLSEITDEISRQKIIEKFVKLRKIKENEIRIREDEITVIDDILRYVEQYQIKTCLANQISALDSTLIDLSTLNSPLSNEYLLNTANINLDNLSSLFSPLTTTPHINFSSPITPTSNLSSSTITTTTTVQEQNQQTIYSISNDNQLF